MVSNPARERDLEDSHDQRTNQVNKYSFFQFLIKSNESLPKDIFATWGSVFGYGCYRNRRWGSSLESCNNEF